MKKTALSPFCKLCAPWLRAAVLCLVALGPAGADGAVQGLAVGILTLHTPAAAVVQRVCSASLIAADQILTAAHCVFDPTTGQAVPASALHFQLTRRDGVTVAERDMRALRIARGFRYDRAPQAASLGPDLAVLTLDRPLRIAGYDPLLPAPPPPAGAYVAVLSHAAGARALPIWQDECPILAANSTVMAIGCAPSDGQSGAPVLVMDGAGVAHVVGVLSARATVAGRAVMLAVPLVGAP